MILVIDDEPEFLEPYFEAMVLEGYKYKVFKRAEDGMKYFVENQQLVEAVILDVMMPPPAVLGDRVTEKGLRTGLIILKRIREENSNIPVMLLTNLGRQHLSIPAYDLVEIREKKETPAFVLPKLLGDLIKRAEDKMKKSESPEEGKRTQVVFQGPVDADQILVGDYGTQSMEKQARPTRVNVLNRFCAELMKLTSQQQLETEEHTRILKCIALMKKTLAAPDADRTKVAAVVGKFSRLAPWAKKKLAELATGTSGSVLGAAIVEGVKFALKMS